MPHEELLGGYWYSAPLPLGGRFDTQIMNRFAYVGFRLVRSLPA